MKNINDKKFLEESNIYLNKANEFINNSNFNEAEKYYNKSLNIREKILGTNNPTTAIIYNNLGELYYLKGYYKKSKKYLDKAFKIREEKLEENHIELSYSYLNLGEYYYLTNNYDEALKWTKSALELRKKILGDEHLDTIRVYKNLADIYFYRCGFKNVSFFLSDIDLTEPDKIDGQYFMLIGELHKKALKIRDEENNNISKKILLYECILGLLRCEKEYIESYEINDKVVRLMEEILGETIKPAIPDSVPWVKRFEIDSNSIV